MSLLTKYTLTFEGAQIRDSSFATKLGYAIDTRIFRWLDQCSSNIDRELVNDSLLDFNILVDQVLTDSFIQHLPVTIKRIEPTEHNKIRAQTPHQKRQRLEEPQPQRKQKITNEKTIDKWIVSHDQYAKYIAGTNIQARPKLNNTYVCPRFHSRGYCFEDCKNVSIHVSSHSLSTNVQKEYKSFIKQCTNK